MDNERILNHRFLSRMYADGYYPHELVDEGVMLLERLCERIESDEPHTLAELYAITHAATKEFNKLARKFRAANGEIETVARDIIGADFEFIAGAYGFSAEGEELIAPRDW